MKYLLIVSDIKPYGQSLKRALKANFNHIEICRHQEALKVFVTTMPSHALICQYIESHSDMKPPAWVNLKAISIGKNQIVLRSGILNYRYRDYIKQPIDISQLLKKFKV